MSLKILHLFDHSIPLQSGYTFRSRAILLHQQKMGYEIRAITSNRQGKCTNALEELDSLSFYRVTDRNQVLEKMPIVHQYYTVKTLGKRLKQVLSEWQPDIVHAHSPCLTALAALPVVKKFNIPIVYEIRAFWEDAAVDHGTHKENSLRYKMVKQLETKVGFAVNQLTTICEGLRGDLISRGIPQDKITVIPNAVDLSQFTYVALSTPNKNNLIQGYDLSGKFIIGFIGSLYSYEGLDTLISAFPKVKENIPNAVLLIVGGGPQFEQWKKLATQSPANNDIIFTGRVPHQQVGEFYQVLNVLIYPRKKLRLTDLVTPLKPLEAMAMGKCVIASDVGGHKELITNGSNGLLFKSEDQNDLTLKIMAMQHQSTRDHLIAAGRRYVEFERNWPKSVERYQQVYNECLA